MMISDLSSVPEIQLVERDRMQDLIKEIDAQHTKVLRFDDGREGRADGRRRVHRGGRVCGVGSQDADRYACRPVETGQIVKTAQVSGDEDKFFDLQQKLANKLIDGLGIALSPEEQQKLASQQRANRIDAVSTLLGFSRALALYDRGDFVGAGKQMIPVVQASPNAMFLRETQAEIKRRATASATDKAKDKAKARLAA
jgi:hypothetical protein